MEKLVDLLNEFESKKKVFVKWNIGEHGRLFQGNFTNTDLKIISKRYEFIKRLVENDKIDSQKFREKAKFLILSNSIKYYEFLIMELSIQKEPINFLVSVLK